MSMGGPPRSHAGDKQSWADHRPTAEGKQQDPEREPQTQVDRRLEAQVCEAQQPPEPVGHAEDPKGRSKRRPRSRSQRKSQVEKAECQPEAEKEKANATHRQARMQSHGRIAMASAHNHPDAGHGRMTANGHRN